MLESELDELPQAANVVTDMAVTAMRASADFNLRFIFEPSFSASGPTSPLDMCTEIVLLSADAPIMHHFHLFANDGSILLIYHVAIPGNPLFAAIFRHKIR